MDSEIILNHNQKKIKITAKTCNFFEKFKGLMFTRKEKAKALLFDFKKPVRISIHSFFVFFPFLVIWLDNKNEIIEIKLVKPFNCLMNPKKPFIKIVEIPANKKYKNLFQIFVGDRKI